MGIFAYINKNNLQAVYGRNHGVGTRFAGQLLPDYHRLHTTGMSIGCTAPNVWNDIPVVIKNSESLAKFKRNYRMYLLSFYR